MSTDPVVHITNGLPDTGTGNITTLGLVIDQMKSAAGNAAQINIGAPSVLIDQYANYKTIAASQTAALCGATGAQYDYLAGVLIVPATTSPGNVLIRDGNGSDITVFVGGATSVGDLRSFVVPLGLYAVAGTTAGWRITTGANVSVIAIGKFT
jgi:hypothetical protein